MKPTTENKELKEIERIEKEIFGNVSTAEFVPPEVVAEIIREEVGL